MSTLDEVTVTKHNQTRILILRLFATPVQRNDLAVLSHSFDRRTATLIRRSPIGGSMFGASDLGEFFLELVPIAQAVPFVLRLPTPGADWSNS